MTLVVVAGAVANKPGNPGEAWVRLSWAEGLRRLGLDVHLLEELPEPDPRARAWFDEVVAWGGWEGRATLLPAREDAGDGQRRAAMDLAGAAALVLNISGHLRPGPLLSAFRAKAYVDIDPGFTQLWFANGTHRAELFAHDVLLTIGMNIGSPGCPVPTEGLAWHAVPQPVVLDQWPVAALPDEGSFTTIATWRNPLGTVTLGGRTFGLKVHEFRRLANLPRAVPGIACELAVDMHPADAADRDLLEQGGWRVVDATAAAASMDGYRGYIRASFGEISPTQAVYADLSTGWFSDRSTRYLATGRPVVVQDTGFDTWLPTGEGVLGFSTPDSAAEALRAVARAPLDHAEAARDLAERVFAHDVVLPRVLDVCGIG